MKRILVSLLVLCLAPAAAGAQSIITAPEAWKQAQAGKLMIIDVRSTSEWKESGIPKGAKTISYHDPGGERAFVAKVTTAVKGNS